MLIQLRLGLKNGILMVLFGTVISLMAMRPDVRRHTIILITFSLIQWGFVLYILNHQLFDLDKYQRILLFCLSCFGGAFVIMGALIYLVVKGNTDR